MKNTVLIALLLFSFYSKAQSDTIRYEIIENNLDYNYIGGGLSYTAEISGYNLALAGLGFNVKFYNPKFDASLNLKKHFYEGDESMQNNAYSVLGKSQSSDMDVNFNYYISNKNKNNEISVSLARVDDVKYVTYVKAKTAVRYGVDLGFKSGRTFYNFGDYEFEKDDFGNSGQPLFNAPISSYLNYNILTLGFNKVEVEGLTIETKRFGIKKTHSFVKIYGRALILLSSKFDDVLIENGADLIAYKVNDVNRLPVGFMIGYEHYSMGKIFHAGWGAEIGITPGASVGITNNLSLNIKVIINLGKRF